MQIFRISSEPRQSDYSLLTNLKETPPLLKLNLQTQAGFFSPITKPSCLKLNSIALIGNT